MRPETVEALSAAFVTAAPALGWALVHFLWQGAALAALAAAAMALVRDARARYAIGVGTLVVMMAAPLVTTRLAESAAVRGSAPDRVRAAAPTEAAAPASIAGWTRIETEHPSVPGPTWSPEGRGHGAGVLPPTLLRHLVALWLAGVALFSLRTAGGLWLVQRIRAGSSEEITGRLRRICDELQVELGIQRVVRYCQTAKLATPAVIGWFRPVVLLPVQALTGLSESQLRLVVAHELAHIRRLDPFVNLLQVATEALLFYHPAIWWLNRRIRTEREHCCDDIAVAACSDRLEYARALAELQRVGSPPSLAMAAARGPVAARVARLLGADESERHRGSRLFASSLCLALAVVTGVLLIEGSSPRPAEAALGFEKVGLEKESDWLAGAPPVERAALPEAAAAPESPTRLRPLPQPVMRAAGATGTRGNARVTPSTVTSSSSNESDEACESDHESSRREAKVSTRVASRTRKTSARTASKRSASSSRRSSSGAAESGQDFDTLEAYAVHGVTAEYRDAIRQAGLDPSPDEFVALRIHGVDPEYVRTIRDSGFAIDEVEEIIELRIHGVSVPYINGLRGVGIAIDDRDDLVALRVQGVTPEYVRALAALDLPIDIERVIELRVQGITPAFVGELRAAGVERLDDIVAMRIQGVTPSFIRALRETGLDPSPKQILELRIQGVTPSYVQEMRESSFAFDVESLVAARIHGITPAFVRRARDHGFETGLQQLIHIRELGLLDGVDRSHG